MQSFVKKSARLFHSSSGGYTGKAAESLSEVYKDLTPHLFDIRERLGTKIGWLGGMTVLALTLGVATTGIRYDLHALKYEVRAQKPDLKEAIDKVEGAVNTLAKDIKDKMLK